MTRKTIKKDVNYLAQDVLSRRDHSAAEVRQKLLRKDLNIEDIDIAIEKLKKIGLIDDEKFAEKYILDCIDFKSVGPKWIQYKLRGKGISTDVISNALSNFYPPDIEQEIATSAKEKWQKSHTIHRDDQLKLQRFLFSRGFSSNTIRLALDDSNSIF